MLIDSPAKIFSHFPTFFTFSLDISKNNATIRKWIIIYQKLM